MVDTRPKSTSASAAELRNYFLFADHLQQAIPKNRLDTDFAQGGGKIVYFLDANLALTYLLGEEEHLKIILSFHRLMEEEAARVSQDLTIKYILSGGLPGQHSALAMTPLHWNEAIRQLQSAARKVTVKVAERAAKASKALKEALPSLHNLSDDPDAAIALATKVGLSELLTEIRQALGVNIRIAHALGKKPRIRAADGMSLWHSVVNRTRYDDYRQWRALLTRFRERLAVSRDNAAGAQKLSHNLDADAKTLACIEALYRETPDSIGEKPTRKFLFISSDSAILYAAKEREKLLSREGIPNFVREPLVYNPLINFSAMHNRAVKDVRGRPSQRPPQTEQLKQIFSQVENAIDALFPSEELPRTVGKDRWARHWELQKNVQRWSDAAEQMGIVNAQLLIEEVGQAEAKEVAAIFAKDNIAIAAGDVITSRIAEIKEDHALNMSTIAFDHLATLLASDSIRANAEARAPTKIFGVDLLSEVRSKVGPEFRPKTWAQLLEAIPHENVSKVIEAVSTTLRDIWDEPKGQLLASSIYLGVHAWESALACATTCEELAPGGAEGSILRREANYCRALSLRMMLRSEEEVRAAEVLLNQNIARNFVDPVVKLRDAVERCTLLISACVVQAVFNFRQQREGTNETCFLVTEDLQRQFDDAVRELSDVVLRFGEEFSGTAPEPALVPNVVRQGAVNRLGAELLRHYLQARLSHEQADLVRVLRETEATLGAFGCKEPLPHPVTRGYMEVARYEVGERAQGEVLSTLREIRKSKLLTDADEVEFKFIESRVLRNRTLLSPEKAVA